MPTAQSRIGKLSAWMSNQYFLVFTVGGAPSVRKYWSSFVQDTKILVYVVDASDEKRLPESFSELHRILGDERLVQVPILVISNKQVLVNFC